MDKDLSPSVFAAECLGLLQAKGKPAERGFVCAKCGGEFAAGEVAIPFRPSNTFCDESQLAERTSMMECGWCAAFSGKSTMMSMQDTFLSRDLSCSLKKGTARRWIVENLAHLKPPYLFLMSDTQLAHLVWRTPLTWDRRAVQIRIAGRLFSADFVAVLDFLGRVPKDIKILRYADREVRSVLSGQLTREFVETCPDLAEEFATFGPGEWWTIAAMAYDKEPAAKPEPLKKL